MSIDYFSLISIENPICLYCKGRCDHEGFGEAMMVMDSFVCHPCNENFTLFSVIGGKEATLSVTCNDIRIFIYSDADTFKVGSRSNQSYILKDVYIPKFDLPLDDKEKLYQKLKTYLIFS